MRRDNNVGLGQQALLQSNPQGGRLPVHRCEHQHAMDMFNGNAPLAPDVRAVWWWPFGIAFNVSMVWCLSCRERFFLVRTTVELCRTHGRVSVLCGLIYCRVGWMEPGAGTDRAIDQESLFRCREEKGRPLLFRLCSSLHLRERTSPMPIHGSTVDPISARPPYCALWGLWCLNMTFSSVHFQLPNESQGPAKHSLILPNSKLDRNSVEAYKGNGQNGTALSWHWERPHLLQSPRMSRTGISTKNTEKIPPGPIFWTPRIYHQNTPKIPKIPKHLMPVLGIFFSVFWRSLLGFQNFGPVFFLGRAVSGLCSSVAGQGVLNPDSGHDLLTHCHFSSCLSQYVVTSRMSVPELHKNPGRPQRKHRLKQKNAMFISSKAIQCKKGQGKLGIFTDEGLRRDKHFWTAEQSPNNMDPLNNITLQTSSREFTSAAHYIVFFHSAKGDCCV